MRLGKASRQLVIIMPFLVGTARCDAFATPANWIVSSIHAAGTAPEYDAVLDRTIFHSGEASGLLRSTTLNPAASGALMQAAQADSYQGKKVRFSAYIKSQDVAGWAGLWLRAEDARGHVVAFQNAITGRSGDNEPIIGNVEWHKVNMVVEIPVLAAAIYYGVQLSGQGSVWIDDASIKDTAIAWTPAGVSWNTAFRDTPPALEKLGIPVNLDFER